MTLEITKTNTVVVAGEAELISVAESYGVRSDFPNRWAKNIQERVRTIWEADISLDDCKKIIGIVNEKQAQRNIVEGLKSILLVAAMSLASLTDERQKLTQLGFSRNQIYTLRKLHIVKGLMGRAKFVAKQRADDPHRFCWHRTYGDVGLVATFNNSEISIKVADDSFNEFLRVSLEPRNERRYYSGSTSVSMKVRFGRGWGGSPSTFRYTSKYPEGYTESFWEEFCHQLDSYVATYKSRKTAQYDNKLNKRNLAELVEKTDISHLVRGRIVDMNGLSATFDNNTYVNGEKKDGLMIGVTFSLGSRHYCIKSEEQFDNVATRLANLERSWRELQLALQGEEL